MDAKTRIRCNGCKKKLPASAFGVNRSRVGGRHHSCRACANAATIRCRERARLRPPDPVARVAAAALRENNPDFAAIVKLARSTEVKL